MYRVTPNWAEYFSDSSSRIGGRKADEKWIIWQTNSGIPNQQSARDLEEIFYFGCPSSPPPSHLPLPPPLNHLQTTSNQGGCKAKERRLHRKNGKILSSLLRSKISKGTVSQDCLSILRNCKYICKLLLVLFSLIKIKINTFCWGGHNKHNKNQKLARKNEVDNWALYCSTQPNSADCCSYIAYLNLVGQSL